MILAVNLRFGWGNGGNAETRANSHSVPLGQRSSFWWPTGFEKQVSAASRLSETGACVLALPFRHLESTNRFKSSCHSSRSEPRSTSELGAGSTS